MRDWKLVLYKYANIGVLESECPDSTGPAPVGAFPSAGSIPPGHSHFCLFISFGMQANILLGNTESDLRTRSTVKCSLYTFGCVPLLVGCYANDRLLRMYNPQRGSLVASTAATRVQVYRSIPFGHQHGPLGETEGCTDAVLPLLASFVPHVLRNINQSNYSDCTIVRFGKSFAE